jgi:hypothetical protein
MAETRQDEEPLNGVTGVLAAFKYAPVVALGELHRVQEVADFVSALVHHPHFPMVVNDIVVEFGNARYQALMDRFIVGEPIADADLRCVWRDVLSSQTCDAPIYEHFFRTVRAVNRTLSPEHQIRVVLGDPPIDWKVVHSIDDVRPFLDRDVHLAAVVEQAVLQRGRRALVIAGVLHVVRNPVPRWTPRGFDDGTAVHIIEANYPNIVYSIVPHVGFSERNDELEPQLATWPLPALLPTRGTWIGALSPNLLFAAGMEWDGDDPYAHLTLAEVADAYLYLGPRASLTASHPNPAIYRGDPAYVAELQRRHELMFNTPLNLESLYAEEPVRYRRPGQEC